MFRRSRANGRRSSATWKTRKNSSRLKSLRDRMSRPSEASHDPVLLHFGVTGDAVKSRRRRSRRARAHRCARGGAGRRGRTSRCDRHRYRSRTGRGRWRRGASPRRRRAAGRRVASIPADDRQPVVRLVVEDPVGDAVRLLLPGPHELGPVPGGEGEGRVDRLRRTRRARQRARTRARAAKRAARLDGVEPRLVDRDAERCRPWRSPAITDDASAPPPTWMTTRSIRGGPSGGRPRPRSRARASRRPRPRRR